MTVFGIYSSIIKVSGYIDIGDGCWRRNVLVTTLGCHQPSDVTNITREPPTFSEKFT